MLYPNTQNLNWAQIPLSRLSALMVLRSLGPLVKYSADLIGCYVLIVVGPLCVFADEVQDFNHRIVAELQESNQPQALWVGGLVSFKNVSAFDSLFVAIDFIKIFWDHRMITFFVRSIIVNVPPGLAFASFFSLCSFRQFVLV